MLANIFISCLTFFCSKLASSEIPETEYIWRHLPRFTRRTFFFSIKPFTLECSAQSTVTIKADKIHLKISFLKIAEHRKSGQCTAGRRRRAGTLPVASPMSLRCASRKSPTGHEGQAFVITCSPHARLLLVPSANQMLPKLTAGHIPKSRIHTSVLSHAQW